MSWVEVPLRSRILHWKCYIQNYLQGKNYAFKMACVEITLRGRNLCIQNVYASKMFMHSKCLCIQNVHAFKLYAFKMFCTLKVLHSNCLRTIPCIQIVAFKKFSLGSQDTVKPTFMLTMISRGITVRRKCFNWLLSV